jgi:prevent-host-death family protein
MSERATSSTVERVGVRELRQRASELLRRVAAGETIEITDRGRPVAILAPLPDAGPLARLRAAGEITPATGSLDDLPDPLPVPPGQEPASAILARLRRDER